MPFPYRYILRVGSGAARTLLREMRVQFRQHIKQCILLSNRSDFFDLMSNLFAANGTRRSNRQALIVAKRVSTIFKLPQPGRPVPTPTESVSASPSFVLFCVLPSLPANSACCYRLLMHSLSISILMHTLQMHN